MKTLISPYEFIDDDVYLNKFFTKARHPMSVRFQNGISSQHHPFRLLHPSDPIHRGFEIIRERYTLNLFHFHTMGTHILICTLISLMILRISFMSGDALQKPKLQYEYHTQVHLALYNMGGFIFLNIMMLIGASGFSVFFDMNCALLLNQCKFDSQQECNLTYFTIFFHSNKFLFFCIINSLANRENLVLYNRLYV
jgi:hypothetical protein